MGKREIIRTAIDAIDTTTELFYQQNTQEGYAQLEQTLTILFEVANSLYTPDNDNNECSIDNVSFNTILSDAMNALEQKDTILMSDILQYDLKVLLVNSL